ncbi:uncharacterized protein LOC110028453 [Phalaenopsis equestris]|uniref:uncharacterized protein LOC110028453 n=1 Tax=Phalaenopsis equestris TaxID=78828 RepID=UPI0009E20F38|nr:uncharacterized protein LOC110028453 [Phalaenopsis equestris]
MFQEPQQISIQDNKFSSLMLSKENFESNSSLRFYYAVSAIAVPFTWESRPGLPKNTITTTTIPPLTPPPSFYSISSNKKIVSSTRSHKSKSIKLTKQVFSSSSSSSWSSSNSLELKGEARRGFYSMAMIKNVLLEIATCSKF